MDIQLGNPANLYWLWLAISVGAVFIAAVAARRAALARFATSNLVRQLVPRGSASRRIAKAALATTAIVALVLALVDVRWGRDWREVPQKGIEVMFVLDVSRSMLAEDASPNRLERAKQQIRDMIDEMRGDRVGLVVFAGDVRQRIPLTSNYQDFKLALDEVGPHSVDRGGSRLGDAIRAATRSFLDKTNDHKAIVAFTDGEDHESEPLAAAEDAADTKGVRVFTVGLGDFEQGARIPVEHMSRHRAYLQHNGEHVWSKMNGEVLEQIASKTGGAYIPAGTKQVDMAEVYRNYVSAVEQTDFETARIQSYVPRFQWFAALALLLIVVDSMIAIGARTPWRTRKAGNLCA
ncbi:MAG: VWA domain-containing protein [Pirellulales bacterium]|nr:VWA domain-containing protein [Pirellulales bacterium]